MKLVPLYNKVIVEIIPDEGETVTPGGLVLVEKKDPYYRGKVVGVGPGHYQNAQRIPMDVKEGDILRFLKNSGMGVEFDTAGMPLKVVLTDLEIYAIEEPEEGDE